MTLNADYVNVINAIHEGFADAKYPGDDNITVMTSDEARQIGADFKGKHWMEVPNELLGYHRTMVFFSPEGFRYFLPAAMIAVLRSYEEVDILVNSVVFSLQPPDPQDTKRKAQFEERFNYLPKKANRAVALFLQYLSTNYYENFPDDAPKRALSDYWAQFL